MATLLLILTCGVVFFLQPDWALSGAEPEPLAILTAQLYHRDFNHLAMNMAVLGAFGWDFERRFRGALLLLFCAGAGIFAVVCESLTHLGYTGQLFGASGFIAALCGVYMRDWRTCLVGVPIAGSLLWSAFVAQDVGVAHGAHLGGLAVGVLFGIAVWTLRRPQTRRV